MLQDSIFNSLTSSICPAEELLQKLTVDNQQNELIRRRIHYELTEMSDFLDYFLEEIKNASNKEIRKKIDFVKSEFQNRKKCNFKINKNLRLNNRINFMYF
jgi:hypothetical protein